MIRAQGGDPDAPLPVAKETEFLRAKAIGIVAKRRRAGHRAWPPGGSGAGRARKEHPVSFGAGVVLHKRPGDRVAAGDVLAELRADDPAKIATALRDGRIRL